LAEKVQGEVIGIGKTTQAETLQSVVKTSVQVKEKSGIRKLFRGFFVEDLKTVRKNIWNDVIVPSVKTGIANAITGGVYMWLFGKNGYSNAPGGIFRPLWSGGASSAYSNIVKVQNGQLVNSGAGVGAKVSVASDPNYVRYTSADVYDPDYIRYASWQDAENVFASLCERIGLYHVATVKNLYDLSGMTGYEMVLQNWGWYDLPYHRVIPVGDGTFVLKLPQPTPLGKT
jgi:hypothetical protein